MAKEKRTLEDFRPLWPAEQLILDGLDDPHVTQIGDGTLPPADAPRDRQVRASFLRWCALGAGDDRRLHETGLRIAGALVVSDGEADPFLASGATPGLDLAGCRMEGDLGLFRCRFADPPLLRSAHLRNLFLNGGAFPGLTADRLTTEGVVYLRDATAEGEVRLLGARIGGNLSCTGGTFRNPEGRALSAEGAAVTGDLFWRSGARAVGALDLTAANFGAINDDPSCWPDRLLLDRCRYGAFTGLGISAEARIDWLSRQNPADYGKDFWPQPWEQCARVLREMGHAEDARAVLIDKERRLRQARRARGARWARPIAWARDIALDQTVRFGRQPLRAFIWLALLWALGLVAYAEACEAGAMKPNNAVVLRSDEWTGCADAGALRTANDYESQVACYLDQPQGKSYPSFNAPIYAADVLFPLVEIEQQANWTPDTNHPLGVWAKAALYLSIIFGWALSLLAVAGFSGLVKSD